MIGRLEELAAKAGRKGDNVMLDFYMGRISYREAEKRLRALAEAR